MDEEDIEENIRKKPQKELTEKEKLQLVWYMLFGVCLLFLGMFLLDYGFICFVPFLIGGIFLVNAENHFEKQKPIKYSKKAWYLMLIPILFFTVIMGMVFYFACVESQTFREGMRDLFFYALGSLL